MIPSEYSELIQELTEGTRDGSVHWKPTVNEREFLAYFDEFTLSVRDGLDDENDSYVNFTLKDGTGKNIDSFTIWDHDSDFSRASLLHSTARRRALRIDDAIKSIVSELRKKKPSKAAPSFMDEDDEEVPF